MKGCVIAAPMTGSGKTTVRLGLLAALRNRGIAVRPFKIGPDFIESKKKFYAECGGLMYLAESIDGARMVGLVPARIEMTDHLVDFGYCEIATRVDSVLGPLGTRARGHQFH